MDFTGERYVPEKFEGGDTISKDHLQRYDFSLGFVAGKYVLDIACGEGYGSDFMAEKAEKVIGIDIDKESIDHAKVKYTKKNVSFDVGSVVKIPIESASVDVVVSFETIEHVGYSDQESFLKEVKRVLKPGGLFIVSTPDKDIYGEGHNKFHVREVNKKGFLRQLSRHFKDVDLYGQNVCEYKSPFFLFIMRIIHSLVKMDTYRLRHKIFPKSMRLKVDTGLSKSAVNIDVATDKTGSYPTKIEGNRTALYLVALCKN